MTVALLTVTVDRSPPPASPLAPVNPSPPPPLADRRPAADADLEGRVWRQAREARRLLRLADTLLLRRGAPAATADRTLPVLQAESRRLRRRLLDAP